MVIVGVMNVVEEVVVADVYACLPFDVSIGVVDAYVSFVIVCVVEVACLAVVVFVHGEAAKLKQRAKHIKKFDSPVNM